MSKPSRRASKTSKPHAIDNGSQTGTDDDREAAPYPPGTTIRRQ
jgi:hypothetical protein